MGTAPIVDLRASVKPDVSTCTEPNTATGFSYILNEVVGKVLGELGASGVATQSLKDGAAAIPTSGSWKLCAGK